MNQLNLFYPSHAIMLDDSSGGLEVTHQCTPLGVVHIDDNDRDDDDD